MNMRFLSKLILLSVVITLAGCGSITAQPTYSNDTILSAQELELMIQVTVTDHTKS